MKCFISCTAIFLFILSCGNPKFEEGNIIILITEKASEKDGLYLNLSDPEIIIQTYSGEEVRYFAEFDKNDRKSIPYAEAYKNYKERYKKSYYELFPSDLLTHEPNRTYNAIMIDTLKKKAFTNKIGEASRMY